MVWLYVLAQSVHTILYPYHAIFAVWAWWIGANALLVLSSMACSHDFLVPALCKSSGGDRRSRLAKLFLAPTFFMYRLVFWICALTVFRADKASTPIPGTNISIASLPKFFAAGTPKQVPWILVDCTSEMIFPLQEQGEHPVAVFCIPALDDCLPSPRAISDTVRRVASAALCHPTARIVVGCMYGHRRSAGIASLLAATLYPGVYPGGWASAFAVIQRVRPNVHLNSASQLVLGAAANDLFTALQ